MDRVLLLVILMCPAVTSYTVLMLPIQLQSHISNFVDVGTALVKKGHQVYTGSYKGYREVDPSTSINTIYLPCKDPDRCTPEKIAAEQASYVTLAIKHKGDAMQYMDQIVGPIDYVCRELLSDETFWNELNKLKFDLVFVDGLFPFRCMYLIPHRLGVPWITLSDFIDPLVPRLPWLPSFVPHPITTFSDQMTFIERLQNAFLMVMFHYSSMMPPLPKDIIEKYKGYGEFSNLAELEGRSMLWLHTHDDVIDYPRPSMPNVINVGGLSTKNAKTLNPEYKLYVEQSKNGVILVSFGSYLVNLPDYIAVELLEGFKQLKENVIWRFKNENNLTVPHNVKLTGWMPQNDLIAHKNVKMFITHAGNNGQFEGLYHGKPMLAMPISGDQLSNAAKIQNLGYGLTISLFEVSGDKLFKAAREILDNPVYKTHIEKASSIFRDREETPVERAVFWIEHVLKYGGDHLRSYALNMTLYEYFMFDIALFVLIILLIVFSLLVMLVRLMVKMFCSRKKLQKKQKYNKSD